MCAPAAGRSDHKRKRVIRWRKPFWVFRSGVAPYQGKGGGPVLELTEDAADPGKQVVLAAPEFLRAGGLRCVGRQ